MNWYTWDIETGPQSDERLAFLMPEFHAPSNYKDAIKIAASIKEQEAAWVERAALSALTGEVLAIGVLGPTEPTERARIFKGKETDILADFWGLWQAEAGVNWVGFNIKGFDLPFLAQRSIVQGVPIPGGVMAGRYWSTRFVDLQELWLCYGRDYSGHSLGAVARACGCGIKTGDGANFAKLWATDRAKAMDYLQNDLEITRALGRKLGVIRALDPETVMSAV
jgi:hypothetical protein